MLAVAKMRMGKATPRPTARPVTADVTSVYENNDILSLSTRSGNGFRTSHVTADFTSVYVNNDILVLEMVMDLEHHMSLWISPVSIRTMTS